MSKVSAPRSVRGFRCGFQISRLNGQPACTPTDASPPSLRTTTHGSGPVQFRYAFTVGLFHSFQLAGFGRRTDILEFSGCRCNTLEIAGESGTSGGGPKVDLHHQGLGNALIDGEPQVGTQNGAVVCRERLGGLLNFYCRNVDPQERIQLMAPDGRRLREEFDNERGGMRYFVAGPGVARPPPAAPPPWYG